MGVHLRKHTKRYFKQYTCDYVVKQLTPNIFQKFRSEIEEAHVGMEHMEQGSVLQESSTGFANVSTYPEHGNCKPAYSHRV